MVNLYRRPCTKLMIYFSECISFRPLPYEYPSKDPFGTSTYRANFRKSSDPKQGTLPTSPLRKNNPHPQSMTNAFNFPNRVRISSRYDVMIWACNFRFLFGLWIVRSAGQWRLWKWLANEVDLSNTYTTTQYLTKNDFRDDNNCTFVQWPSHIHVIKYWKSYKRTKNTSPPNRDTVISI